MGDLERRIAAIERRLDLIEGDSVPDDEDASIDDPFPPSRFVPCPNCGAALVLLTGRHACWRCFACGNAEADGIDNLADGHVTLGVRPINDPVGCDAPDCAGCRRIRREVAELTRQRDEATDLATDRGFRLGEATAQVRELTRRLAEAERRVVLARSQPEGLEGKIR